MRVLILCKSVHHQNTAALAGVLGNVLEAEVRDPDETPAEVAEYDLIGFGSGVYFGQMHPALSTWIRRLPEASVRQPDAFLFATCGLPFLWRLWRLSLKSSLKSKGFEISGEFVCAGFDTFGPLMLFGGIHRSHPNKRDLARAAEFGHQLRQRVLQRPQNSIPMAHPS